MMMMGMAMEMEMGGGNNNQVGAQNEGAGVGEGGIILKKGPWTAAEDAVLADYVRSNGEGNWNAVQKNTGLARCGKSCRLRWANHLRPNLKKGTFSPEEERIIVELHAKMGNKWARMATQLPGRTDNEIKNFWNTRVKRRQRQGIPLYPPDIQPLYNQHQQNHQRHHSLPTTPTPLASPLDGQTSTFSFQTTTLSSPTTHQGSMLTQPRPLHFHRSASSNVLYNHHSTLPPLHSPGGGVPSPLVSPSHHHVPVPFQSPHNNRHQFSTLPLFDSSTPNAYHNNNISNINFNNAHNNNNHNSNLPSDFFFPRETPPLHTPVRFKRFKQDTSHESNNDRLNNNVGFNGGGGGNTGSSFMLQYPPSQKTSFSDAHAAATSPLTSSHYSPSYAYDPVTLDVSSSTRMLNDHQQFEMGQFVSNPELNYQLKTNEEHPSNQFLSLDGNSDITFDTKGNNDSYISNDHSNNQQNLSMSFSGGGLLDDMLEEAQMLANDEEIMRPQNCMTGFNGSSGDIASGHSTNNVVFEGKEETVTDQEINATQKDYSRILDETQEDYSRILNVMHSSMSMPELYNNCENAPTCI